MSPHDAGNTNVLAARVRVPEDVVIREFEGEAVALNLRTGRYHGLNAVAGRMIEAVSKTDTAEAAIATLAVEFDQSREVIERDLETLIRELADRGLVELNEAG